MEMKPVPQMQVRSNVRSGAGGGYVNGAWYPDMSGVCGPVSGGNPGGGTGNPGGGTSGGGYVGGKWYPDASGICG